CKSGASVNPARRRALCLQRPQKKGIAMSVIRKLTTGFLVTTLTAAMATGPALAASGALKGNDGSAKGTVTVTAAPKGVVLRIEASGLTPGWHGAHFHEKGDCSDAKFTSAGSHVHGAVPKVVHGLLNPE